MCLIKGLYIPTTRILFLSISRCIETQPNRATVKSIMRFLLATNNRHKHREMTSICSPHEVLLPEDFGIHFEFEETGDTFFANSFGKARALLHLFSTRVDRDTADRIDAVIADDSGISVDALNGAPGVYSARFGMSEAGELLSQEEQNNLLLEKLNGVTDRAAHYTCNMTAALPSDRFVSVQETWLGTIASKPTQADGGFGYDPIFLLQGTSTYAAELTAQEKHRVSHRGKATRSLIAALAAMSRE